MKNGPYELKIAPENYPGKKYRGKYCYEHHLVYWQKYGVVPKKGEVIHHKNHSKRDNKIENLELITEDQHKRHHHIKHVAVVQCRICLKWIQKRTGYVRTMWAKGLNRFYCSKKCQHKGMTCTRVGSRDRTVNAVS